MTAVPSLSGQLREQARIVLARWQDDPVAFARDVLKTELWHRQAELVTSVANHSAVACRGAHKVGKSTSFAVLALWFVCTRPRARVIFTAASFRQVERVLWKEIKRLYRRAAQPACSECRRRVTGSACERHPGAKVLRGLPIGGDLHESAEGGLQFSDGREVIGFSTKEPERMAGFSGPNVLFLVDEASGVPDEIFDAIEGNRAGGARICMISNPTQTSGTFYEAFTSERSEWHQIHISATEIAAEIKAGRFPAGTGLATPEWVEEKRRTWGEDDSRYQVRVLGEFPRQGDDAMIGLSIVDDAKKRWTKEVPASERAKRLQIGVDVAYTGRDLSVICWSRGKWASAPIPCRKGMDPVEVASEVMKLVRDHRLPNERPVIRIDVSNMGAGVYAILKREEGVEVVGMLAAESATVDGYSRIRDQVWGAAEAWLREGGALPGDPDLVAELLAPIRKTDVRGRLKVESKIEMRSRLGKSPDRADAFALAVFPPPKSVMPSITSWGSTRA